MAARRDAWRRARGRATGRQYIRRSALIAPMLFPTIDFAIFFAVAFTVNWLLNPYAGLVEARHDRAQLRLLRLGGLELLPAPVGDDGRGLRRRERDRRPRATTAAGASPWSSRSAALLGILGWFKYYGFVSVNLDNLTHALGLGQPVPLLQVALPIAISFFTFMAISYVVDIYRRKLEPAKPLDFAVYLSFFPHLLAGPIVRGHRAAAPDPAPARPRQRSTTRAPSG